MQKVLRTKQFNKDLDKIKGNVRNIIKYLIKVSSFIENSIDIIQ